ncbi:hypothetical protein BDD12DRAFT_731753 [Trichophaea hybrida]|nr:hypothetical protein BDD12DRAFT_731753 [Trichophaea hybrida]
MTRTHKSNDVPHNHPEAETAFQEHKIPKFFGKSGFIDQAPNKVKKNGAGRGNWGHDGEEFEDLAEFTTFKPRRRSNSMGHIEDLLPSKFEQNEEDPVFEEEEEEEAAHLKSITTNDSNASSTSATSGK